MMEGIEVLATIQEITSFDANAPLAIIVGAIAWLGFGIWCGTGTDNILAGLFMGLLIGAVVFLITLGFSAKPAEYIDTYKVTISEDVKLNEFYERYEIINQEGKIYTIKERMDETANHHAAS